MAKPQRIEETNRILAIQTWLRIVNHFYEANISLLLAAAYVRFRKHLVWKTTRLSTKDNPHLQLAMPFLIKGSPLMTKPSSITFNFLYIYNFEYKNCKTVLTLYIFFLRLINFFYMRNWFILNVTVGCKLIMLVIKKKILLEIRIIIFVKNQNRIIQL